MIHRDKGVVTSSGFRIRVEPLQETVYRYRPINEWLERILVQDELYFATPEACNDPFDCRFEVLLDGKLQGLEKRLADQVVYAQMLEKMRQTAAEPFPGQLAPTEKLAAMTDAELHGYAEEIYTQLDLADPERQRGVKATLEAARNRLGICCFAGRGDNLLMFAHYADQHRGCCLEFQIRDAEGNRQSIFEETGWLQFQDVVYQDAPPNVQLYELGTVDSLQRVTLTKHSRWAYEEEVRVMRFSGPGPVRYRREAITGLIFGCKASDQDMNRTLQWLGPERNVVLSRAVPDQDYGLRLVPL